MAKAESTKAAKPIRHPFRRAVLRGLGVVLPPLLTIVIFFWVGGTVQHYVMRPVTGATRYVLAWALDDSLRQMPEGAVRDEENPNVYHFDGESYRALERGGYVPLDVYQTVLAIPGQPVPDSTNGFYSAYVQATYLQPYVVLPIFLLCFVASLYLLGGVMAAGIGRVMWNLIERGINRLPLVSNVYTSVKQVTDFMLSDTDIEYTRVVAVEYPRKGIWSIGLVTGEGLLDIRGAANEAVLSVLIPSSPMPVTGYTITVLKSEAVDLNMTVDQAFQFCISCGVVVPAHQMQTPFGDTPPLADATLAMPPSDGNAPTPSMGHQAEEDKSNP
jgi:uncharacterized membrane protein